MSKEIIKVLDELCYQNIKACVWIIMSIEIITIGIVMIKFLNKWRKSENYNNDYDDDDMLAFLGYIFSICIIALEIGLIIGNIIGIAKNIYMPEMVVYEYIKKI